MGRVMKDSGIEWIGEIPEGWDVCRIKNIVNFNPRYDEAFKDGMDVSFTPMEYIGQGNMSPIINTIEKVKNGYTYFANEDIVMAKVTPCFENGNIAIADNLINGVGFGSFELYVFRCTEVNTLFLYYLDTKCTQIDGIISGKQKLIEKLTAYKKSLIYECVTGKRSCDMDKNLPNWNALRANFN